MLVLPASFSMIKDALLLPQTIAEAVHLLADKPQERDRTGRGPPVCRVVLQIRRPARRLRE